MNQQDESNQDKPVEQNEPLEDKMNAEEFPVEQKNIDEEVETAKESADTVSPPESVTTIDADLELPDWILDEAPAEQAFEQAKIQTATETTSSDNDNALDSSPQDPISKDDANPKAGSIESDEQPSENQGCQEVPISQTDKEIAEAVHKSQSETVPSVEDPLLSVLEEENTGTVDDRDDPPKDDSLAEPEDPKKHKIQARKMSYPFNKMVANFAGCGRCSYFLAGYRVLQGELVLEKAANRMKLNQLQLPWDAEMRKLLVHSFGIHFDVDFLRFNGSCPECGRPFTYKESMSQKKPNPTFTIQFNFKNQS